jgi:hypothetical protein
MPYSLILLVIVLAVSLFAEWLTRQSRSRKFCNRLRSVTEPSVPLGVVPASAKGQTRRMNWISIDEFIAMLSRCSDLIVIDFRANAQWGSFPAPTAFVIPVVLNELDQVLERLPAERCVVFCGASNLSLPTIFTSSGMRGSAPIYFLEGDLGLAEVA